MQRRDVIASLGASLGAGLAGCARLRGGCRTPSGDIHDSLPRAGGIEETAHTLEPIDDPDDGVQLLYARYRDAEDRLLVFRAVEWASKGAATDSVEASRSRDYSNDLAAGTVQVAAYVYEGVGPDREAVRSLLVASPVLEADCVESRLVWG
jgi:hypothetical protein